MNKIRKTIVFLLLTTFMCLAVACGRKNTTNDNNMAGTSQPAQESTGTTSGTQNTTVPTDSIPSDTDMNNSVTDGTQDMTGTDNTGDSLLEDVGDAVNDVVDGVQQGVDDVTGATDSTGTTNNSTNNTNSRKR